MRKYFGTDGIRGRVGQYPITPDFALRLGFAAGMVLKKRWLAKGNRNSLSVMIAKDTRLSGYLFESSLEAGFSYAGVNVLMAGPLPTPAVAYLTKTLRLALGVVISASHNPYYDNGIKFFAANGCKLADSLEAEIEHELENGTFDYTGSLGKVSRLEDVKGRYIEFCKNTFPNHLSLRGLKIVIDCANGATYQVAPAILSELGATVIAINCQPNGENINANCGSTSPQMLVDAVVAQNAHLGIAFDGDGDRVIMTDSDGALYNGDKLLYIIANYYNHTTPISTVAGTVLTNMALEEAFKKKNINLIRAQVGDRYVLEVLQKNGLLLGGEASGHLLCLDKHTTGDGIIAALQVLAALVSTVFTKDRVHLGDLIDWQDYAQAKIDLSIAHANTNQVKGLLMMPALQSLITTISAELANAGRVVTRLSGTEPVIRIMVETKLGEVTASKYAKQIAQQINAMQIQ